MGGIVSNVVAVTVSLGSVPAIGKSFLMDRLTNNQPAATKGGLTGPQQWTGGDGRFARLATSSLECGPTSGTLVERLHHQMHCTISTRAAVLGHARILVAWPSRLKSTCATTRIGGRSSTQGVANIADATTSWRACSGHIATP